MATALVHRAAGSSHNSGGFAVLPLPGSSPHPRTEPDSPLIVPAATKLAATATASHHMSKQPQPSPSSTVVQWLVGDDGDSFFSGSATTTSTQQQQHYAPTISHRSNSYDANHLQHRSTSQPIRRTISLQADTPTNSLSSALKRHSSVQPPAPVALPRSRVCSIANSPNLADVPVSAIVSVLENEVQIDAALLVNTNVISVLRRSSSPISAPSMSASVTLPVSATVNNLSAQRPLSTRQTQSARIDSSYVARVPSPLELPSSAESDVNTTDPSLPDYQSQRTSSRPQRQVSGSNFSKVDTRTASVPAYLPPVVAPPPRAFSGSHRQRTERAIKHAPSLSQFTTAYSPSYVALHPELNMAPQQQPFQPAALYPLSDYSEPNTPLDFNRQQDNSPFGGDFYTVTDAVNDMLLGNSRSTSYRLGHQHSRHSSTELQYLNDQANFGYY